MAPDRGRAGFDEAQALENLERLREELREARARRERKEEEFAAWVQQTRTGARADRVAALEQAVAEKPAGAASVRTAAPATEQIVRSSAMDAAPAARTLAPWMPLDEEFDLGPPDGRTGLASRRGFMIAGASALAVLAFVLWQMNRPVELAPLQDTTTASPSVPQQPPSPGRETAPGGAAPAAPRHALQIELTTTRAVWMRVVVDGERRVERVVPAGERLTFGADSTIVLRAGDGGGVRLTVNGRDEGPLGRDGQIAVRTLTPR